MNLLAHDPGRPNPAARAFLEAVEHPRIEASVDARDEMLRHLLQAHHGSIDAGLVGYFRTGLMAARLLEDIGRWRFGARAVRILEFASGYGRVTRFIRDLLPSAEVIAAEVDEGAVAFQRSVMGVSCLKTEANPESVAPGTFDVVFAASFFSHLPEARFEPWLRRLYSLVAPGGALVLSTHGEETLPRGRVMPAGGLYFEAVSESDRFGSSEYGSTWVQENYVDRLLERISSGKACYRCFRRALWHSQDVYVIAPQGGSDLSSLRLRDPAQGYLDACYLEDPCTLLISGWAALEAYDGQPIQVEAWINSEVRGQVTPELPRPDAEPLIGGASQRAGFVLRVCSPQGYDSSDMLTLVLRSTSRVDVIHAGSIEVTGLYLKLVQWSRESERLRHERECARAERDGFSAALARESQRVADLDRAINQAGWQKHVLEQQISDMKRSRFWKARDAWFRLSGRKTTEP